MSCRQCSRGCLCFIVAVLLASRVGFGQAARQPASPAAGSGSPDPSSVPTWLAWKVFHDSLAFYGRQSISQVNGMLTSQFGLDSAETAALLNARQPFLAAIERIDTDARAEVQTRYGTDRRPPADLPRPSPGRVAGPAPSERPIVRESGKTLRDMVRESGLYDQVEEKKRAALAAHLAELERAISPAKLARIGEWVQTSVAPRVKTVERGSRVPGVDRSSSGDGRFVKRGSTER